MSDQWHLLQEGQQYGPYTGEQLVEFANDGRIVRDSMLWAEGMAEWVQASQVEGLFPPEAVPVATPAAPAYVPGGSPPPWMRGGATPQLAARPIAAPLAAHPGMAPMGRPGMLIRAVPGENYPPTEAKGAWFGLLVALMGGGMGFYLVLVVLLGGNILKQENLTGGSTILLLLMLVLAVVAILIAQILHFVYLHRLWSSLSYADPRTTPGKAVGMMFVPFFNLYWIFVAIFGLAQDWNRITRQHPNLQHAPKMSEGLFLTYCILLLVFWPLAWVLWFPLMAQICRSINFMAYRPVHHAGTFNIR